MSWYARAPWTSHPTTSGHDGITPRALYVAGRYDPAIEQYRAAADMAPDDARAQLELAGSLASLKRYDEAVEPIRHAMRLNSDDIMIYRVAAIIFRQMGWPNLALDANKRSAELGDRLAIYELSQMYSLGIGIERDPDEAVKWLTKAAESGHVAAMDQMVRVYLQGELGQSVDHAKAEQWRKGRATRGRHSTRPSRGTGSRRDGLPERARHNMDGS